MRFSERIGKTQPRVNIQIDSMDTELKNGIYNVLHTYIFQPVASDNQYSDALSSTKYYELALQIWVNFFKERIDELPYNKYQFVANLKQRFSNWDYLEVYNFINFLTKDIKGDTLPFRKDAFVELINIILSRELSGYRVVGNQLVPITNEEEKKAIEVAIDNTCNDAYQSINIHLKEALKKISDRNAPDYRNSIKESISAVESMCQIILGEPKAELGKALKRVREKINIHPSLEQGFSKIYGYTSDSDGIRHALQNEPSVMQEDAIFMLVACSAFINYLMVKSNKNQ